MLLLKGIIKMKYKKAFDTVVKTLKEDKGLYIAWQSNIAMAFYDTARQHKARISRNNLHKISNEAATYFLWLLCK
jgi:hypothetical protein